MAFFESVELMTVVWFFGRPVDVADFLEPFDAEKFSVRISCKRHRFEIALWTVTGISKIQISEQSLVLCSSPKIRRPHRSKIASFLRTLNLIMT